MAALHSRWASDAITHRNQSDFPVVVVGGLALGGAGRTPVVGWLAEGLWAQGRRAAVVSHGYGAPLRRPVRVEAPDLRFGDEAAALRRGLPSEIPVWSGPRRPTVAAAREAGGIDVILVDGGYFDDVLPCRLRVAVVDATAAYRPLPAGPLRAPLSALARADFIWLHRVDEPGARPLPAPWQPRVESRVVVRRIRLPGGEVVDAEWLRGRPVRPLTGIARPASFHHLLTRAGAQLLAGRAFADHHRFTPRELAGCLREGPHWVTTTKDFERLPPSWPAAVVETSVEVAGDPDGVLAACRG